MVELYDHDAAEVARVLKVVADIRQYKADEAAVPRTLEGFYQRVVQPLLDWTPKELPRLADGSDPLVSPGAGDAFAAYRLWSIIEALTGEPRPE